ncbi:hypothetical protein BYT27DRAFT_7212286 [Phlegmacium glaucopus]|nr:hypothetical protein BYT27DRAFT_7212286 [Phlegmacium glaucopus]
MYEMGVDAYTTAKVLGTDQVGCFMDSQSFNSYKKQAEVLFGLNVITGGFILGPAIKFIKSIAVVSWQSQREGVKNFWEKFQGVSEVEYSAEFESLTTEIL